MGYLKISLTALPPLVRLPPFMTDCANDALLQLQNGVLIEYLPPQGPKTENRGFDSASEVF
jgi:hypothetical protein